MKSMFNKKTAIAGASALAAATFISPAMAAADYKGPNLKGEVITMTCPWTGAEEGSLKKVIAAFEQSTGATVKHSCSQSSEQQIVIDIKAGSPSNISVFPQPGLAANMAAIGGLTPLGDKSRDWVTKNFAAGKSWADLGTYAGKSGKKEFYGLFYNVNVKSLVWYIPENFKEKGYKVPKSMEELQSLTKKIAADGGGKPWCIGLGSDAATGWPATDWVEDFMLRTQTPDVYDGWVSNKVKFNDPRVIAAIEAYGAIAKNDAYVDGGASAVATVSFKDSPKGLFGSPPKCYMHRQASFIPAFFPEGKSDEADFFYFPSYSSKKLGNPVLGGGTIMTITKDSKGARAFMEYLQHAQAHEIWMAEGGFLTPHKGADINKYKNKALKKQGEILLGATTFRFDGSDLMPGAVGAGSFWKGMVNYSSGQSAKQVADEIQKSWDAIK
jgi:alpha-glucoside transport system substrate-binding protein